MLIRHNTPLCSRHTSVCQEIGIPHANRNGTGRLSILLLLDSLPEPVTQTQSRRTERRVILTGRTCLKLCQHLWYVHGCIITFKTACPIRLAARWCGSADSLCRELPNMALRVEAFRTGTAAGRAYFAQGETMPRKIANRASRWCSQTVCGKEVKARPAGPKIHDLGPDARLQNSRCSLREQTLVGTE